MENTEDQGVDTLGEATEKFPCPKCGRDDFRTHQAMRVHLARSKSCGRGWPSLARRKQRPYRSESREYKRAHYQKVKARNAALGLNARGKPLQGTKMSIAMKKSWADRKQQQLNGAVEPAPKTQDIAGDAAKAILVAANVIRAVTAGLKIGT